METKRYTVEQIEQAAADLKAGELISFPTETVYGLGQMRRILKRLRKFMPLRGAQVIIR